jgi:pantoate kinase
VAQELARDNTCKKLKLCGTSTELSLFLTHQLGCGVADLGAVALGKALRTNSTLEVLDLSRTLNMAKEKQDLTSVGNRVGNSGATALAQALAFNRTLLTLKLGSAV